MHEFFDEYANSDSKPMFLVPFGKETKEQASAREMLMIYTLGELKFIVYIIFIV
jgi:hypothetical protein